MRWGAGPGCCLRGWGALEVSWGIASPPLTQHLESKNIRSGEVGSVCRGDWPACLFSKQMILSCLCCFFKTHLLPPFLVAQKGEGTQLETRVGI